MSAGYFCDVCGKAYKKNEKFFQPNRVIREKVVGIKLVFGNMTSSGVVDMCDECLESLLDTCFDIEDFKE